MGLTSQPTKTDASLGRVKSNDQPVTDLDTQVPAAEWERIKTAIIDIADEVGNHVGTAGDLNTRVDSLETLTGGIDLTAHAARHILGGADPIDGDQLGIDYTPSNYTPSTSPAEATSVDHLAAHLAGIDAGIATASASGPVDSVFGRTGAVVAADGDYAASQIVDDSAFGGGGAARVDAALDAMLLLDGTRDMTGALTLIDGTDAATALKFASSNAGIFLPGSGVPTGLAIANAGGGEIVRFGSDQVLANTSSGVTAPQYSFISNAGTGVGLDGGDVHIRVDDQEILRLLGDDVSGLAKAAFPLGDATDPGLALNTGSRNDGIFGLAGVIGIATSGTERVRVDETGAVPKVFINGSRLVPSSGTQNFLGELGAEWDTIHVGKISTSGDLELAQSGLITAPDLTASGDVGLPFSVTANQSTTDYYDGQRIDVTETATGDGTADPDGIGNTVQRWRVDSGSGLATVAAIEPSGNITTLGILKLGASADEIKSNGSEVEIAPAGASAARFSKSGTTALLSLVGGTSEIRFASAQEKIDRVGSALQFSAGAVAGLQTAADPGTPADGDTNIAIREHQDPGGGVTAALSNVTLGPAGSGSGDIPTGFRPLLVPER